jgi:hypothetical protein
MVPCIKTKAMSAFLLIALLFVPIAGATDPIVREAGLYKAPEGSELKSDLFSVLSVKIEIYNQKFDEVPILFQRLVGSEQIAGRIKLENDEMLYVTFLMTGGKVLDFYSYDTPADPYSMFEPSIIVETDEQTVRKILESEGPLREAVNGMNEGIFNVEAKGFFRDLELKILRELYSS